MALCCDWICCCEICRFCRFNDCSWTARSRTCWKSCENLLCPVNDAGVMRLEIELDMLLMLLSRYRTTEEGARFPRSLSRHLLSVRSLLQELQHRLWDLVGLCKGSH